MTYWAKHALAGAFLNIKVKPRWAYIKEPLPTEVKAPASNHRQCSADDGSQPEEKIHR